MCAIIHSLSSNDITAEGEHAITGVAKTLKDLCVIG